MRFERHLFVCTNAREAGNPKGCCASKGGAEVAQAIKLAAYERGLKGKVRVNKAGCLDACAEGLSAVVYPDGIWYRRITLDDVEEIVQRTLVQGEIIERLVAPQHPRLGPTPRVQP
ncbi:MAG: (2Fe-2S) ferredoxin domain-containing protein [Planctomycetota bacterium]|nr:MAG: (2Fe-2S) ferredoxin domain-containing protein [Planctomycetota bacterium]